MCHNLEHYSPENEQKCTEIFTQEKKRKNGNQHKSFFFLLRIVYMYEYVLYYTTSSQDSDINKKNRFFPCVSEGINWEMFYLSSRVYILWLEAFLLN